MMQRADLLEERKNVAPTVPRRDEAIHIYGVDVLSTGDVLKYFADYGPQAVEWINDSSCMLCNPNLGLRCVCYSS